MKKLLAVLLFVFAGTFLCGNALALSTYIPHITSGEANWTDYLQVNNNTPSAANFTLTLYSNSVQIYSQVLSVGGLSRSQIELKALNPNAETGIITYTEPGLVFRVSYNNWAGGIAEFRTIDALGSNVGFYFSDFTNFVQWKGSAIANMGTAPAEVTLYVLGGSSWGSGGSILGTHTATINPRDKIVGIHSAWFNVDLSQIESIVAVTTSASLCGIAIGGDLSNSRLLFTPAAPVSNFTPPPPPITPPVQSLIGTYTLSAFELYYDNGLIVKSTDAIVKSYSGTWKIRSDMTTTQMMEFNGTTVSLEATWKVNSSTGNLEIVTTTGVASVLSVTTSGNVLTTNTHVTIYGGYREYDHWTKISDSVADSVAKIANEAETVNMPETLNSFRDYQFGTFAGQIMEEGK